MGQANWASVLDFSGRRLFIFSPMLALWLCEKLNCLICVINRLRLNIYTGNHSRFRAGTKNPATAGFFVFRLCYAFLRRARPRPTKPSPKRAKEPVSGTAVILTLSIKLPTEPSL